MPCPKTLRHNTRTPNLRDTKPGHDPDQDTEFFYGHRTDGGHKGTHATTRDHNLGVHVSTKNSVSWSGSCPVRTPNWLFCVRSRTPNFPGHQIFVDTRGHTVVGRVCPVSVKNSVSRGHGQGFTDTNLVRHESAPDTDRAVRWDTKYFRTPNLGCPTFFLRTWDTNRTPTHEWDKNETRLRHQILTDTGHRTGWHQSVSRTDAQPGQIFSVRRGFVSVADINQLCPVPDRCPGKNRCVPKFVSWSCHSVSVAQARTPDTPDPDTQIWCPGRTQNTWCPGQDTKQSVWCPGRTRPRPVRTRPRPGHNTTQQDTAGHNRTLNLRTRTPPNSGQNLRTRLLKFGVLVLCLNAFGHGHGRVWFNSEKLNDWSNIRCKKGVPLCPSIWCPVSVCVISVSWYCVLISSDLNTIRFGSIRTNWTIDPIFFVKKLLHYCIDQYLRLLRLLQDCAAADLPIWGELLLIFKDNWDLETLISFFEIFIFFVGFVVDFGLLYTENNPKTDHETKEKIN